MSTLASVARKINGKFTAKLIFRLDISCYHCWCWHWKSKVSPYNIWQVFGPYAGEILTKSYGPNHTKFCAFWQEMANNFWQSVDVILEVVSVTETIVWGKNINLKTIIFQCSKNCGTPTCVTRLKVKSNMADPISLNENLP